MPVTIEENDLSRKLKKEAAINFGIGSASTITATALLLLRLTEAIGSNMDVVLHPALWALMAVSGIGYLRFRLKVGQANKAETRPHNPTKDD